MQVLLLNGSPRDNGNTSIALAEMEKVFEQNNVSYEEIKVGKLDIHGCVSCDSCESNHECIFDDILPTVKEKFKEADGLVIASPVYYASANGTLISLLDRLFRISNFDKRGKVGCSVTVARRGGCSATFDELNKYFTISGMPVCSSQYWNMVHGNDEGEAKLDLEGLQTMRTLANNMVFLMKAVKLGIETFGLPEVEKRISTNFIR